jgi:predicted outer membrane repeat protein
MFLNKIGLALLAAVAVTAISEATVLTVGPSDKYDFESIQDAILASNNGDEIIVAPGVYGTGGVSTVVNPLGKAIWIHSSVGAGVTIIDGGNGARGLRCSYGEGPDTIIEGFTIRNCKADGGGGALFDHASPTILNCIFENNISEQSYYYSASGGAIYCDASSAVISGCTFISNYAEYNGGAIYNKNFSSPTISNCEFEENSALKGGAICNSSSSDAIVSDCTFTYNSASFYGGAVYLIEYCSVTMTDCELTLNSAQMSGGGIYNQGGELTTTQCLLSQNFTFESGGGLTVNNGNADVTFSAFEDNVAPLGGGIYIASTSSVVTVGDSVFCGNSIDHITGDWADAGDNEFYAGCDQGACCTNDVCVPLDPEMCVYVAGDFQGLGSICTKTDCPEACVGDVNDDGVVDTSDILALIGAWGICP